MRGFLIFLAFAVPVMLASPTFWSVVNMQVGAERVGYGYDGGVTQWAWIGPKSPWPKWAIVPADSNLTVRAHFEAAPGHNAMGYAEVEVERGAVETASAYAQSLTQAGWTVESAHVDIWPPDFPPHKQRVCLIEGRKDGRALRLSLMRDAARAAGSVYWAEGGAVPPISGSVSGPC